MQEVIQGILREELNVTVRTFSEITGLGSVNRVFKVAGARKDYILRLNESQSGWLEYLKEEWCIGQVRELGIPSPEVLRMGKHNNFFFMIQVLIKGTNGSLCQPAEKEIIWQKLGTYAAQYHHTKNIEVPAVMAKEFHKNWQSRLQYNLQMLNDKDTLLKNEVLDPAAQRKAKVILSRLEGVGFKTGLVHGDLCPRNTIRTDQRIYLLDWGTAEVNVVPHTEIGTVLLSDEASATEFSCFLEGLGISAAQYRKLEPEVAVFNFLHWLDKYRWAEDYDVENIKGYEIKARNTLDKVN